MQTAEELSKCDPETIEQHIEGTRASIAEKIGVLEQEVMGTVEKTKQSMQETVEGVKNAFDVKAKIAARPVQSVCGAILAGAVSGYLLSGRRDAARPAVDRFAREAAGPRVSTRLNDILLSALSGVAIGVLREAGMKAFTSALSRGETVEPRPPEEQPDMQEYVRRFGTEVQAPDESGGNDGYTDH